MPVLFPINQNNATKFNHRTAKYQLVAELSPAQPQLVVIIFVTQISMSQIKNFKAKSYPSLHIAIEKGFLISF